MTADANEKIGIQRSSAVPAYLQLSDILEGRISALSDDDRRRPLPSEADLSREFGLSRITVRQALKRIESKGLVYSEQGRGSFPTIPRIKGISGFHSFTTEVLRNGQRPGSRVLSAAMVGALPAEICEKLSVPAAEAGAQFHLRRLRLIDGVAVAVEDAFLPPDLYPGLDPATFGQGSLYEAIARQWGHEPAWTDALIEPAQATPEIAATFDIAAGDPVLIAWRVTLTASDQVFERVRSIYRPGFALRVARHRLG